ncbi:hypothetical protein L210DRAFT_3116431 [Boletus edulis BED1]|uniref:Secreted protein n=1 Tax=Boletus edulis BED1 TaxID=1328754 RepID=A0AAD4G983_BOLED|nr:hypothetical protein L210DRAFT_3116431 [Boletus edulis BED1]
MHLLIGTTISTSSVIHALLLSPSNSTHTCHQTPAKNCEVVCGEARVSGHFVVQLYGLCYYRAICLAVTGRGRRAWRARRASDTTWALRVRSSKTAKNRPHYQ